MADIGDPLGVPLLRDVFTRTFVCGCGLQLRGHLYQQLLDPRTLRFAVSVWLERPWLT